MAITDLSGNIIGYQTNPTVIRPDFTETFDPVLNTVMELMQSPEVKSIGSRVLGCGLSLRGLVNTEEGVLHYSAAIPQWRDIAIQSYLEQKLQLPVVIENDSRALAVAEMMLGAGMQSTILPASMRDTGSERVW